MSANNLPVAGACAFCGKRWNLGSGKRFRQAAPVNLTTDKVAARNNFIPR